MIKLYGYWRSSATYRVRIALNLKGQAYERVIISLIKDGGQQLKPEYLALNPQGRVPFLVDGDFGVGQSLAILDYLESKYPQPPLVPADAGLRARMLAFCHAIVSDVQPLQNTGPLGYLVKELGVDEMRRDQWARHWIERGLSALERERSGTADGACVFGDQPTWADCVLVPQVYNAERYGCDLGKFPRLYAIAQRLRTHPAFTAAQPDQQPDKPQN